VLNATVYALVESWARGKDGRAQRAARGKGKSGALEGKSWPPVTPRLHSPVSTHDRIPCSRLLARRTLLAAACPARRAPCSPRYVLPALSSDLAPLSPLPYGSQFLTSALLSVDL